MTTIPTTPSERAAHARHGYSSLQIAFHWSIVVLVVVNWFVGHGMSSVFEAREAGQPLTQWGPAFVHIALGLAIFGTMVARLLTRLRRPVQTAPDSKHRIMALLGKINHWAFYAVLLAMPPLGLIAWLGGSEFFGALHSFLAWVLVFLIAAHLAGNFAHVILGENIIKRMVRPGAGT